MGGQPNEPAPIDEGDLAVTPDDSRTAAVRVDNLADLLGGTPGGEPLAVRAARLPTQDPPGRHSRPAVVTFVGSYFSESESPLATEVAYRQARRAREDSLSYKPK